MTRWLLLSFVLSALALGCTTTREAPDTGGSTGDAATVDGGTRDAGPLADTGGTIDTGAGHDTGSGMDSGGGTDSGSGTDSGGGTDTGAGDAGHDAASDAGLADLVAAQRANVAAICVCDHASDFSSAAACTTAYAGPALFDTCLRAAFAADAAAYDTYLSCHAAAVTAYTACLSASGGCVDPGRTTCDDDFDTADAPCDDPDTTTFNDALDACVASMIVGTGAASCSDTAAASTATGDAVFTGTTLGAGDHFTPGCGGTTTGPDRAHRWTATTAGDYTFDTLGSDFDTVLYFVDDCAETTTLDCDDDGYMDGYLSQQTLTMTAGQTIQIVIDGYRASSAGNYVINIH